LTETNLRVLIVEDDPTIRELLSTLLGFEGWQVAMADDGPSGLEAAERVHPDVVLVDVTMPGLSGYEVCRQLKAGASPPRVVMVTGRSTAKDEVDGRAAGADAFLRKPFSPLELLDAVTGSANGRHP
jgi:two-component system phosphate regulon response regulator PhoB